MVKITLSIDGMYCGMCEAHINDVIRNSLKVRKVSSSHKKGITEIISETVIDESALKDIIKPTGYEVKSYSCEDYKKGLFR